MKFYLPLVFLIIAQLGLSQVVDVFPETEGKPERILIDNDNLYIIQIEPIKLLRVDLTNEPLAIEELLELNGEFYGSLIIVENVIYLSDFNNGKILIIDLNAEPIVSEDYLTNLDGPNGLAVKNDKLYFSQSMVGGIYSVDFLNPGIPEVVVANLDFPTAITFWDDELYVSDVRLDKIAKINTAEAAPVSIDVITGIDQPIGLKIRGNELFYADKGGNTVSKANLADLSLPPVVLTDELEDPIDIDFYGEELYMADYDGKRIVKMANVLSSLSNLTLEKVTLSPNPATDFISLTAMESNSINYQIFDVNGKLMLDGVFAQNEQINISTLAAGSYIIRMDNDKIGRFIKN